MVITLKRLTRIVRSIFVCIDAHIFTLRIYLAQEYRDKYLRCPVAGCGTDVASHRLDNFKQHVDKHDGKTKEEEQQIKDIFRRHRKRKPKDGVEEQDDPSPGPSDPDNTGGKK